MLIPLRAVVDVRELPPNRARASAHLPSIRSLVSEHPHPEEAAVLRYLQQGVFGCFYPDPGLARDVVEPGMPVDSRLPGDALGVSDSDPSTRVEVGGVLTDGVWLWPGVLGYYVVKYHVMVDPAFVEHARAMGWTIRESDVRLETLSFDAFAKLDSSPLLHESSLSG